MSSAVSRGASESPVAEPAIGAKALFQWAQWLNQHSRMRAANQIGVFRKGNVRLVVHDYGDSLCACLKLSDSKPKLGTFRGWHQPFHVIKGKLEARGWVLIGVNAEVGHAAH